jgi:hypothetical protein
MANEAWTMETVVERVGEGGGMTPRDSNPLSTPRPFGYVLIGSVSLLALYFLTTPTTRLSEFLVGQWGIVGAAIGYGIERCVVHWRHWKLPHNLEKPVGLNRQSKIFVALLSAFLFVLFVVSYLMLLVWTGWGRVAVY